jgi:hypothetical protein
MRRGGDVVVQALATDRPRAIHRGEVGTAGNGAGRVSRLRSASMAASTQAFGGSGEPWERAALCWAQSGFRRRTRSESQVHVTRWCRAYDRRVKGSNGFEEVRRVQRRVPRRTTIAPTTPATVDPARIPTLAESRNVVPSNASVAMKSDIVNPIPPNHAHPCSIVQLTP